METRTRTWLIWGGIAVVALLLVGGTLLFGAKAPSLTPPPGSGELTAETTGATGAGGPGSLPSGGQAQTGSTAIVPAGAALPKVTKPPAKTVAYVSPKAGSAGDSWSITFVLYGTGPERSGKPSVVAAVRSAKPTGKTSSAIDPAGNNMLLVVPNARDAALLSRGGTYAGTLVLIEQGEALALAVRDVAPR